MSYHNFPRDQRHGTRGRYILGCRCDLCKNANRLAYHKRKALSDQMAHEANVLPEVWTTKAFRSRDGVLRERPWPGCTGVDAKTPCPTSSSINKASIGRRCGKCRNALSFNGLVPAGPVLKHLKKLSKQGVGYARVALAANYSRSGLHLLMSGRRTRLRALAAKRILAVDRTAIAAYGLVDIGPTKRQLKTLAAEFLTKTALAIELGSTADKPSMQIGVTGTGKITHQNAKKVQALVDKHQLDRDL